ncbi:MAG: right-handed parallel beta-helix repeat-containing protein, partial [Lentisphaerae bacterium]|nr:right-handed parallel beta-helix repeat-containing protein [Lentisphaerota bacterium]
MKLRQLCLMAVVGGMLVAAVQAGEYFVGLRGDDANDGLSRTTAFASIQRGLDAISEGDILTIMPGEYFGHAQREDLGGLAQTTVIRAELPGTVVLRGDLPAPAFVKVPGRRFVYAADFAREPQAVNELDTLTILESLPHPAELEFVPGAFHYDAENQKLYVSTSDLQPPQRHAYTISVIPTHGLYLERPQRVVIEGLAFTGFSNAEQLPSNPGFRVAWGLMLARGTDCVVRDCVAYFNGGGICLRSDAAGGNLVERCRAHANYSKYCGEGGNILAFHPNRDVIRDSQAHNSRVHGIRMYGTMSGPSSITRCLGWGNGGADLYIKGDNVREFGRAEYSVAVDGGHVFNFHHSLIGGHNVYHREIDTPRDNIRLMQEPGVDPDVEFADPDNLDFRLQHNSRFRGTGPGGADRGPYPYERNIFYVSPNGSDTHDGLSSDRPWNSLARARGLRFLRPGDTVYLEGGVYEAPPEFW